MAFRRIGCEMGRRFGLAGVLISVALPAGVACGGSHRANGPPASSTLPSTRADTPRRLAGTYVRECGSAVYGGIAKNWRHDAIGAGPVAFVQAKRFVDWSSSSLAAVPGTRNRYRAQKVLVLVSSGATATVVVPRSERHRFALLYDPSLFARRSHRVSDGERRVTFHACRWHKTDKLKPAFNGGFIVAGPGCVSVDVLVKGKRRSRLVLPLGVRSC